MRERQVFAKLKAAKRVWAVAAIHGEAGRLKRLHQQLEALILPGDRLVYLGNFLGHGPAVRETVDELLRFRRELLARPGSMACDIAYVRGSQEEMWEKLLQLHLAADPGAVLNWMLGQGVRATLEDYGADVETALARARAGALQLARWTNELRAAMQSRPGHVELLTSVRRAAYTDDGSLLFVNAGIDPSRPLATQADALWWGGEGFARIGEPYGGCKKVVRGFDRKGRGFRITPYTATIDEGCGFGGPLAAACFDPEGELVDKVES